VEQAPGAYSAGFWNCGFTTSAWHRLREIIRDPTSCSSPESQQVSDSGLGLTKASHLSLVALLILTISASRAQEPTDATTLHPPSPKVRFFNFTNDALLASSAVTLALDGVSTQRLFSFTKAGRPFNDEANPILSLSQSRAWTGAYFAAAFAGEVGGMYYLHRRADRPRAHRAWRVAEKALPIVVTLVEIKAFFGNIEAIHRAECVSRQATLDPLTSPNPCQ
jgi:hypothetical protein